ncbi:MAG: hypothetical protein NVS9B10_15500 [Nevskia sp.]
MPLRNAPSALPTTLRFMAARLLHRLRGGGAQVPGAAYRRGAELTLARIAPRVERCDWCEIDGSAPGWVDSGLSLRQGETVTVLAAGHLHLSKAFDVGFGPVVGLWYRIGDGELAKFTGPGATITAADGGTLWLVTKPPGEFADRRGAFDPGQPRRGVSGAFTVGILRWHGDPAAGIAAAADINESVFGPALRRLREPVVTPAGWNYLWRLGQGEIFGAAPCRDDLGHELRCHSSADVGILQFPVDVPLTLDTRLDWSWCVTQLPSKLAEHIQATHDYLSIAVEFDNGLDLTYLWSAALPVGTVFQCPLPWWDQRETHWVVRSGTAELGRWLGESRPLMTDYETAIGGAVPARIVAVWLIANTAFQRGVGACRYRGIVLRRGDGETVVHR